LIFSGCSTKTQNYKLRAINAKQATIIRQQQAQINQLQEKLNPRYTRHKKVQYHPKPINVPQAPKKNIKLKKVEDSNYSSSYMYPSAKKKPIKTVPKKVETTTAQTEMVTTTTGMTKAECVSMIGEAKFNKYTQMFGSEAASLKRCKMLKAMK